MNELKTSRFEVKKDMEYKLWEICLRIMLSVVNLFPLGVPHVMIHKSHLTQLETLEFLKMLLKSS